MGIKTPFSILPDTAEYEFADDPTDPNVFGDGDAVAEWDREKVTKVVLDQCPQCPRDVLRISDAFWYPRTREAWLGYGGSCVATQSGWWSLCPFAAGGGRLVVEPYRRPPPAD